MFTDLTMGLCEDAPELGIQLAFLVREADETEGAANLSLAIFAITLSVLHILKTLWTTVSFLRIFKGGSTGDFLELADMLERGRRP